MFDEQERIKSYLTSVISEMELIATMSEPITDANEFGLSISGMTIFRACSMSIQYVTETFVKIRNRYGTNLFSNYQQVPWKAIFGMRNFLSHEYADVDAEGLFNTIREDIPELLIVTRKMLNDLETGKLDVYLHPVDGT